MDHKGASGMFIKKKNSIKSLLEFSSDREVVMSREVTATFKAVIPHIRGDYGGVHSINVSSTVKQSNHLYFWILK